MNRRHILKLTLFGIAAGSLPACGPLGSNSDNLLDVAAQSGDFSILIAALTAADLVETLQGPGPFTIFAPTDAAFSALPAGMVADLLLPQNKDQLTAILTLHVVPGAVTSAQLAGTQFSMATLNGTNLQIDGRDGIRIGTALVTKTDLVASNGIIHAIDSLLAP